MNRRVLIFGAGGNLGIEVVKVFYQKGFERLVLLDRHPEKLKEFPRAEIIKVKDLTDEKLVKDLFDSLEKNRDGEDFLFSTIGGFSGGKKLWELKLDEWEKIFKLNLNTNFLLAKNFIKLVSYARGGSMMFTSALSAFNKEVGKSAYIISKAALNNLVEIIAEESKGENFTVNAIAPFVLDTKENREWVKDKRMLISPGDIGALIVDVFLNYKILSGNVIKLPGTIIF